MSCVNRVAELERRQLCPRELAIVLRALTNDARFAATAEQSTEILRLRDKLARNVISRRRQTRTLGERAEEVKEAITVERVFEHYAIKARKGSTRKGSSYYVIECPNPNHEEDRDISCVVWPSIKAFKCYSCGSSGDIIELIRLLETSLEESREAVS